MIFPFQLKTDNDTLLTSTSSGKPLQVSDFYDVMILIHECFNSKNSSTFISEKINPVLFNVIITNAEM